MRARATSVYMKNSPFQADTQPVTIEKKQKLTSEAMEDLFSEFGPMIYAPIKDSFSGDFMKPGMNVSDNCSNRSTERASIGLALSRTSSSCSEYASFEEELKENKFVRSMIIASDQAYGYELVDSIFPELKHESKGENPNFDMITKKTEDEAQTERFHFWLKKAEGKDNNTSYSALFNNYYKSSFVFFLIYNKNDGKSFESIKNEAERVYKINNNKQNNEKFLVLIEVDGVNAETKASLEGMIEFREKYGIKNSINMKDLDCKNLRKQLQVVAKSSF